MAQKFKLTKKIGLAEALFIVYCTQKFKPDLFAGSLSRRYCQAKNDDDKWREGQVQWQH
jgi:hypothetical protein